MTEALLLYEEMFMKYFQDVLALYSHKILCIIIFV